MFYGDPSKLFHLYSKYYKTEKEAIRSWEKTLANKTHDIIKELKFIKNIRELDKRVKVDSHLNQILSEISNI